MRYFQLLFLLILLSLTSCVEHSRLQFSPISFASSSKFSFPVRMIQFVHSENVGGLHFFPVSPIKTLEAWSKDRMAASGKSGFIRVSLREMNLTRTSNRLDNYSVKMVVAFERFNDEDLLFPQEEFFVEITRSQKVAMNASLHERKQVLHDIYLGIMKDFNRKVEHDIKKHFNANS